MKKLWLRQDMVIGHQLYIFITSNEICKLHLPIKNKLVHFSGSLLNLFQYCSVSCLGFLGLKTRGILASRPEMEPAPPTLEGEVLTTGPPRKSHFAGF